MSEINKYHCHTTRVQAEVLMMQKKCNGLVRFGPGCEREEHWKNIKGGRILWMLQREWVGKGRETLKKLLQHVEAWARGESMHVWIDNSKGISSSHCKLYWF